MNKDQALLLALSALYDSIPGSPEWIAKRDQAAAAIQEVIDPSQLDLVSKRYSFDRRGWKHTALKREWVGLTDEDVSEVERWVEFKEEGSGQIPVEKLIRYIEAKLKEKNA